MRSKLSVPIRSCLPGCIALLPTKLSRSSIQETKNKTDIFCAALAAVGLALLIPFDFQNVSALDPIGVMFALMAGACWASYIIFGKKDFLPRTDFYVQTGPQWGISFVNKLIDLNLLKVMKNKNKKQFIANINCHSLLISTIKSEEIIKFK